MINPESRVDVESARFSLLPNSYRELSNARNAVSQRLASFMAIMHDRYGFISKAEKRNLDGKLYDVIKSSSAKPSMSFYTENKNASERTQIMISMDPGMNKLERAEHASTLINSDTGKIEKVGTILDFSDKYARITQDYSYKLHEEADEYRQILGINESSINIMQFMVGRSTGEYLSLIKINPDAETINLSALKAKNITTDLKTGTRRVERENGENIYLPPADRLVYEMIKMATNFQTVELSKIPNN